MPNQKVIRQKVIRWMGLALVLLVAGMIAVIFVARSRPFHNYVLAQIIQKTQEATGGRVEIADYDIHWSGLRADVHGLAIHGTEPDPSRPLFAAERLRIGLKIASVLRGKVDVNEVAIEHPVVHLFVGEDGTTNIPRPEVPEKEGKPVNLFDLAVGLFHVERGELYYNDRRTPFRAELHELQAKVEYDLLLGAYDGTVNYQQGRVEFSDFNPFEHTLEAAFSAAASGLELERLVVKTGLSEISFRGGLTDYDDPKAEGTFEGTISTQELRSILKASSLPEGEVRTHGSVRYRNAKNGTVLEGLFVDGELNSPLLAVRLPQAGADLRDFRGHYRLENGSLAADGLQADVLGGRLSADFTMRHLEAESESRFKASIRSIELEEMNNAHAKKPLDGVPLTGVLDGTIEGSWQGGLENLRLRADATVKATAHSPGSSPDGKTAAIPVNGVAHLSYDGVRKTVSVSPSYLRTPHTEIRFQGVASERSSIQIEATSDDLSELDRLAQSFRNGSPGESRAAPEPLGLGGSATLSGEIQGPAEALRFTGQLAVNHLQLRQQRVRLVRTEFELSASAVALRRGYLETEAQDRIRFDVSAGLRDWEYSPSLPITIQGSTRDFSVAELQRLLGLRYPVTGALTADISLSGSQLRPAGKASIQLTDAVLWEQPVENLAVELQGNGDSLHSTVAVRTPAGNASGDVVYRPQNQGYEARVEARNVRLDQLQAVRAGELDLKGELTVSAQGQGTLKAPQLEILAEIPQLDVRQHRMTEVKAQARVQGQRANLVVHSKMEEGDLQASADVHLTRNYDATAKLDTRNLPLGMLLASYLPRSSEFLGETEIHAELRGPLKDPERIEAHVEVPTLRMSHQSLEIANVNPIRVDYRGGVVTLRRVQMKGTGTDLQLEGTGAIRGGGSLHASASGTLDLQIVQILRPEVDSAGQVKLDVRVQGSKARPEIRGEVQIVEASFQAPDAPLGIEKLNGALALNNSRVIISELSGQSGGGTLSASGSLTLGAQPGFSLGLTANGVRLRYPYGVRTVLNSQLGLTGGTESAVLSGQVLLERLSFTSDFDLATFLDQFRGGSSPPPSGGFTQNLKLNVGIVATEALQLESAKLSLQGSGNLRLTGTAAQPVILGRATLTGGELFFLGNRYEIQNGVITFTNPFRTEPVVNLAARTTVNQYNLNLTFAGPMENLRTTYTSDPPLPPVDIINLLAFGKVTEAGGSNANAPPSLGAQSVLAKGLSSQISGRVERLAGLSHLSIDPTIGGNQQNPGARLAIQQRVTSKLLFTFAMDVTATESELIQLEYQVNKGWSVSGVRDENGSYAVDVKRRKTF